MGPILVSIVIFGVGLYFFIITNRKIAQIKDDLITKEAREEMGALIAEFNRVAERNINLIEDRIEKLNTSLQKANQKMAQLDEQVARVNRPILVEKIVGKAPEVQPQRERMITAPAEIAEDRVEIRSRREEPKEEAKPVREIKKPEPQKAPPIAEKKPEIVKEPAPKKKKAEPEPEPLSRSERLKALLREGKSRDELVDMGYMENEINLLSFIIRKE
jgi:outer membrane biosynthesis protein TonB